MAVYYNSDGKLQNFEEWSQIVICKKCGKPYRQDVEEQVPGFKDRSYDTCPYCHFENGSSMSEEYDNHALTDEEIARFLSAEGNK